MAQHRQNKKAVEVQTDASWPSVAREWFWSILIAVGLALLIRWPLIEPFKIPSGSMEPTFCDGDRIFVNKFIYGVRYPLNGIRLPFTKKAFWYAQSRIWNGREPQRWDIVVFKAAELEAKHNTLVKRVVGLPGEWIHIQGGKIHVNGVPVELPDGMPEVYYESPQGRYSPMKYGIVEEDAFALVPEGHLLVLGDNSGSSRDGRYFGWLPNHHVLGRVSSIWWPISRWRDLSGFSKTTWWRTLAIAGCCLILMRLFLGRSWRVESGGLGASLGAGDHILINRVALGLPIPFTDMRFFKGRGPRRGEAVLYRPPKDSGLGKRWLMARVAGLPGERVFLDNGTLRVNDRPVNLTDSLREMRFTSDATSGPYGRSKGREYSLVPDGHFFVLVEDESGMPDSRALGWIPHGQLVGVAGPRWWPLRLFRRAQVR